tara:strand:+ start:176 stop:325 length:150 start_codon:yes stop_codon:yes gene_type:complete
MVEDKIFRLKFGSVQKKNLSKLKVAKAFLAVFIIIGIAFVFLLSKLNCG